MDSNNLNSNPTPNGATPQPNKPALTPYELREPIHQRWIRLMWRLYLGGMGVLTIFFIILSFQLPSFEQLENPRSRIASEILSSDGELLGKYYIENRSPVPYDSLSPYLVKALISTEDARFYTHSGIDPIALARVLVRTILLSDQSAGGGSTISQQLAKLLVGRPDTRGRFFPVRYWLLFTTKLKEWLTAVKLERSYTKEEIISLYFNEFDFLYGACGIKSASATYFGKLPSELDITESAMLVRMLQNPVKHNPKRNMEQAIVGRSQVLYNMTEAGHITRAQYDELKNKPIDISKFKVEDHNEGTATYFREHLRDQLSKILESPMANGKKYDLYRDGLKIYTTIDAKMQREAERAAWAHLSEHQNRLFKEWSGWNTDDPARNPWLYRTKDVRDDQLALRMRTLERIVCESDRFQAMREQYMPTVIQLQLRDTDIQRMLQLERANAKKAGSADSLMAYWFRTGEISQERSSMYRSTMGSNDWINIKKEFNAIMDYMKTPIKMKVFAYNSKGEKDTTMSPYDSVRYHRMHLQTGMMAVDPQTGYVKAWVGGINHKYFKYDHVNRAAKRQVGSSIKPFLYALTVDLRGYSSCSMVFDVETTIHAGEGRFGLIKDWTPKNAGGGYSGAQMTLTQALAKSLNSVSAKLMKDLGSPQPFREFLAGIGIDTVNIPQSPTICLGAADISVFEMTGGYTMFANGGLYVEPIYIERIEDKNGNIIYSAEDDQAKEQILSEQGAYVMNQMLKATQSGAGGFNGIKSQHGGKTGTTNFQADGWYVGFTPSLVVGTWVGCDDRFIRFKSLANGAGAKMARPIYQNFLRYIEANPATGYNAAAKFPQPDIIDRELECGKFKNNIPDEGEDIPIDVINDTQIYDYD